MAKIFMYLLFQLLWEKKIQGDIQINLQMFKVETTEFIPNILIGGKLFFWR